MKEVKWWYIGLIFGLIMYVCMTILFPLISRGEVTKEELLLGIPFWTITGLVFGFALKCFSRMKKSKTKKDKHDK